MINSFNCKCGRSNAFIFINDETVCGECFDKYRKERVMQDKMILEKIRSEN